MWAQKWSSSLPKQPLSILIPTTNRYMLNIDFTQTPWQKSRMEESQKTSHQINLLTKNLFQQMHNTQPILISELPLTFKSKINKRLLIAITNHFLAFKVNYPTIPNPPQKMQATNSSKEENSLHTNTLQTTKTPR